MRVTILGCGGSSGVPIIGCECAVCTSDDCRNKRLRSSVFLETSGGNILIDTTPDLRQQALVNNITQVDHVLYTHAHADHIHGIDDTRAFNYRNNAPLPIYGDFQTLERLKMQFDYAFSSPVEQAGWYRPSLQANEIKSGVEFKLCGVDITPFEQSHGRAGKSIGYKIGNFAYSTDVKELSDEALTLLSGIDCWVVDCLAYEEAPTHAHLERTLSWIEKVKPKRAILTHMSHGLDYNVLRAELPDGTEPAFDNMIIANL